MPWVNIEITEGEKNTLQALRKSVSAWKSGKPRMENIHQVATRLLKEKIGIEFTVYEDEIRELKLKEEAAKQALTDTAPQNQSNP